MVLVSVFDVELEECEKGSTFDVGSGGKDAKEHDVISVGEEKGDDDACSHRSGMKESGHGEKKRASRCRTYGGTYTDVPSGTNLCQNSKFSANFIK